jgi:predicted nucleic acid-binding protein
VDLSQGELQLAAYFASKQAREEAQHVMTAQGQVFSAKKVDFGEAECAAVAVARGWRLLSDDSGIVGLMKALHPQLPVQRSCGLLVQAVQSKLLSCKDAADLYNEVFKKRWHLFTKLEFRCRGGKPSCE